MKKTKNNKGRRSNNKTKRNNKGSKNSKVSKASIDVKSKSQLPVLNNILGKSTAVMVFIYADWCGHCQRFKPDWKSLEHLPNRNVPMVSIRDDIFPQSPLKDIIKVEGYPTVSVVNTAEKIAVNVENREKETLTKLLSNNSNISAPPPPPPGINNKGVKGPPRTKLNSLRLNNNNDTIINKMVLNNNNDNDSPASETSAPAPGKENNEIEVPANEDELVIEQAGGGGSAPTPMGLWNILNEYTMKSGSGL